MSTKRFANSAPLISVIIAFVIISSGCKPSLNSSQVQTVAPTQAALETQPLPSPTPFTIASALISQESLLSYIEDLTSIQPYSGWRNSASSGEAEALDYLEGKLKGFSTLQAGGLELERQSFPVYLGTEIWDTSLTLSVNNQRVEVPAESLRAARYNRSLAAYFDTDGGMNDSDPNPLNTSGSLLVIRNDEKLYALSAGELKNRVLFIDYSLIDRFVNSDYSTNGSQLVALMNQGLAGVVLVTHYSNQDGESHGTIIGDGTIFQYQVPSKRVPILYVRIEDLSLAGISTWDDLEKIESASMMLDVDVFSPGKSGNLIARIPGADSSKAVILGAHIDSPNGPGAFDDGSGSAALLEVARVLDVSRIQPPVDVYLAWFGSEELGVYGSAFFASTHQDLLDRTLAMVQMDALGYPLDGKVSELTMTLNSYNRFGDDRLPLPDFLANAVASQGLSIERQIDHGIDSDNSNFDAFNVPNGDLIYMLADEAYNIGRSIHYSVHFHDPYETVDRVREVGEVFVDMTKVMLAAALETGRAQTNLRVTPTSNRRALFVASHTESFGIPSLRELGMALSWEGFDVDLIPYGQAVIPSDLENVGVIVIPPALNSPGHPIEKWSDTEIALLNGYVADGGFLIVVNYLYNYASTTVMDSTNMNVRAINSLLEPMGIRFIFGQIGGNGLALSVSEHPLTSNATYLTYHNNGVPFQMNSGLELLRGAGRPVIGLVDYEGQGGQILVIADLGIIQLDKPGAKNVDFLKNIAHYASTRMAQ